MLPLQFRNTITSVDGIESALLILSVPNKPLLIMRVQTHRCQQCQQVTVCDEGIKIYYGFFTFSVLLLHETKPMKLCTLMSFYIRIYYVA